MSLCGEARQHAGLCDLFSNERQCYLLSTSRTGQLLSDLKCRSNTSHASTTFHFYPCAVIGFPRFAGNFDTCTWLFPKVKCLRKDMTRQLGLWLVRTPNYSLCMCLAGTSLARLSMAVCVFCRWAGFLSPNCVSNLVPYSNIPRWLLWLRRLSHAGSHGGQVCPVYLRINRPTTRLQIERTKCEYGFAFNHNPLRFYEIFLSMLSTHESVPAQLIAFRSRIPPDVLSQFERRRPWTAGIQIARDWVLALLAWQCYVRAPGFFSLAIALLVIAYAQRGISNLLHDCAHYNLFPTPSPHYVIGDLVLATPLMTTVKGYRAGHQAHHIRLGSKDDPDHGEGNETSLKHYRERRFDHKSLFALFIYDVLDHVSFFNNAVGGVPSMSVGQLIYFCTWWCAVSLLAGLGENGGPIGWKFLFLWHTARCTVSYVSYVFRELIDHSGLPSDTIISFTRTLPCCNLFQMFLQPHDDNYHLLHHLLPKVPMAQMHNLHLWMVENIPEYEKANRFESYLAGDKPLLKTTIHVPTE